MEIQPLSNVVYAPSVFKRAAAELAMPKADRDVPEWLEQALIGADGKTTDIVTSIVQNMDEKGQTAAMIGLRSTLTAYKLGVLSGEARFSDPEDFAAAWQRTAKDFSGVDISDYLERVLQHLGKNEFKNPAILSFFQKFDQLYRSDYTPLDITA